MERRCEIYSQLRMKTRIYIERNLSGFLFLNTALCLDLYH